MKNLNEPRRPDDELTTADIAGKKDRPDAKGDRLDPTRGDRTEKVATGPMATHREPEVVPFERKAGTSSDDVPLLANDEAEDLRHKWSSIQAGFVDEPRNAVQEADKLVARAVQRLAEVFSEERTKLEQQWSRGDKVSTEDLRVVLQRYRSFFSRLLSV
jgi:hypothetical protein